MSGEWKMDLSNFMPAVKELQAFTRQDLVRAALSTQFIEELKQYLAEQMDKAHDAGKGLQEGDTAIVRGQTWRGWAQRTVTKYGSVTVDGTRYYMRKFRRDKVFVGPKARSYYRQQNRTFRGTLNRVDRRRWLGTAVRDRDFERVFRQRQSKQLYDMSSELMADRGTMRQAWGAAEIQVTIEGNVLTLRPGPGALSYFARQNELRPIFVLDPPVDEPVIQAMLEGGIRREMSERLSGASTGVDA